MEQDNRSTRLPVFQVDAFTSSPFSGNPAAVCILDEFPPEETMCKIAMEMNLSETAFVSPLIDRRAGDRESFRIRWFTPAVEVPLCGHATLAAAHVIFTEMGYGPGRITFESTSGRLAADFDGNGVTLDFPLNEPEPVGIPLDVLSALGIGKVEEAQISRNAEMLLLRVGNEDTVRTLQPDFQAMLRADREGENYQGVIVTSPSEIFDFISRYFGPWEGLNEDPVTGSAHTVLAPYWSRKIGKNRFKAFQASRRGGYLEVSLSEGRVFIKGEARTVLKGELLI